MSTRKLPSWIKGFLEYTDTLPSPEIFRLWSAISCIAMALERKVWLNTGYGVNLYPNLYVMLVAPPGVGKTAMTSTVTRFLTKIESPEGHMIHLAPASTTSAAIIDDLREATRTFVKFDHPDINGAYTYNSLAVVSNELSVLIPEYDTSMMAKLTDIYDGFPYGERRRTKDLNFKIESPQFNLLVPTTPSYLTGMLPEGAWDQGFLSRTFVVYSGETNIRPLFSSSKLRDALERDLINDLNSIFELFGEMTVTEEAKSALQAWHMKGGPPAPDHPRLINYNTRRTMHLLKLSMISSVANESDLVIREEHVSEALDWLLAMEFFLPDIFKAMVNNGDSKAIDEAWHFCYQAYMKENKPIAEMRLIQFLQNRVPIHSVMRMLEVMIKAELIIPEMVKGVGMAYKPRPRN